MSTKSKDPNRDYQKSKVYAWENALFKTWNQSKYDSMSLEDAQSWVDFIWYNEGRIAPPKVSVKDRKTVAGTGERINIVVGSNYLSYWVLTHEISHSLLDRQYEGSFKRFGHGPEFIDIYSKLLIKYLKFDRTIIYKTLKDAKIDFNNLDGHNL